MNSGKLVTWLETDVGSDLPLTLFSVTHSGLAELLKLLSANNQLHTLIMIVIREICKVPTLQFKVLNKPNMTPKMYIEMENVISNLTKS